MQLSDFASYPNLVAMFLDRAEFFGDRPFLWAKRGGSWQSLSWREAADQVCVLSESLRGLGLDDGDRVALVSENRPEWCIADLGIMAAGCVTVPAYVMGDWEWDSFGHMLLLYTINLEVWEALAQCFSVGSPLLGMLNYVQIWCLPAVRCRLY